MATTIVLVGVRATENHFLGQAEFMGKNEGLADSSRSRFLTKLDEDPACSLWMEKGHSGVVSTRPWFLVDEMSSPVEKHLDLTFNVLDLKTEVMDPGPFGLEKLDQRGIVGGWLDEFDVRVANPKESNLGFLFPDDLNVGQFKAEHVSVESCRLFHVLNGNSNVIKLFNHDSLRFRCQRSVVRSTVAATDHGQ